MQPRLLDRFRLATSRAIAIVLLPVLLVRLGSDFLHSHAAHGVTGVSISAPCEACDIQATVAFNDVAPPVFPPVPVASFVFSTASAEQPFVALTLVSQGRAPPQS